MGNSPFFSTSSLLRQPTARFVYFTQDEGVQIMQRNQFWIFICVGLICGVMIEIMKAPAASHVRLIALKKFEAFLDEGSPVIVADNNAPVFHRKIPAPRPPVRVAQAEAEPVAAKPVAVKPVASPTPIDAKKKAEEDKKKAEEKKKKDEEEKKKKDEQSAKEKEELEAQQQLEQQQQAQIDAEKASADAKAAAAALDTPGNAQQGAAKGAQSTATNSAQTSETVAQWEAYLTQNPSLAKTTQFVQYYKSRKISATTFYVVVNDVLDNSQASIRQQGVQALSLAPSAHSFTALSDEANKETDATTKAQAEQDLQSYATVQNVTYLGPVITGSDAAAALQAIDILKLSADTNLGNPISTTSQGGSTTVSAATLSESYNPFIADLTQVAQSASANASLRSMATETLSDLRSLLSSFQVSQN